MDRLETVKRKFPKALFTGAGGLVDMLTPACGVGEIIAMDVAQERLPEEISGLVGEEEALPIKAQSLDLIVSLLTLHAVNDFVGALAQARLCLKPDGLFLAATFGEGTLSALRRALRDAEAEQTGALAPRIAPFAAVQDFGQALTRAGFALPVIDRDPVSVTYKDPIRLLKDLRGMGETNPLAGTQIALRRNVLLSALERFAKAGGAETFNIVYLTGWAPDASQPKPLKPGTAKVSLAEAVKNFESEG